MVDRRFREGYVLILEFSNTGGATFHFEKSPKGGDAIQRKRVDDPALEKKARSIVNRAYFVVRKYSAHVAPLEFWVPAKQLDQIEDELIPIREDAEKFNIQARALRSTREVSIEIYPALLVSTEAHDRIIVDIVEKMKRLRADLEAGDLHALAKDMKDLYNVERVLSSPLDHQFNAAIREIKDNRTILSDALKNPAHPDEIPAAFRLEYKHNPGRVFARMLEWPIFDAFISKLEKSCSSHFVDAPAVGRQPSRPI